MPRMGELENCAVKTGNVDSFLVEEDGDPETALVHGKRIPQPRQLVDGDGLRFRTNRSLKDEASEPQGVRIAAGLGEKTGFLRRTERNCVPDQEGDRLSRDLHRRLLPSAGLRW